MEDKLRVLTVLNKLNMGGIEKTLLSCIPFLDKQGVKMTILCNKGGVLDDEFTKLGVDLIDFEGNNKPFKDALFLKRILKEKIFDIVHSRSGHTSGNCAKVCAEMGVPFIVSIHNERAMFRNNWIGKPVLSFLRTKYLSYHKVLTEKYSNRIVGHSMANLRYFLGDSPIDIDTLDQQYKVLYNGVDFSKFNNFPSLNKKEQESLDHFKEKHDTVLVHIGSFKEQKNHDYLIDILSSIRITNKEAGLILIGTGGLEEKIKEKVVKLGLEDHVLFVGLETNIAPYLYVSDVFVFPSLYEGFGNVLIEAQYAKLPIWASDIMPHYEAAFSFYQTYMFNPMDIVDGTQKLNKLIKDLKNGSLDSVKQDAFEFSKCFSIELMGENLFNIYQQIIGEDSRK